MRFISNILQLDALWLQKSKKAALLTFSGIKYHFQSVLITGTEDEK